MKVVFIRHGEPDYTPCDEAGFCGLGRDMAPLSEEGRKQAKEVSKSELLEGVEIILSSPYTRTMETAAIVSLERKIEVKAEVKLHELIPDKTFRNVGFEDTNRQQAEFKQYKGVHPLDKECTWETMAECVSRVCSVLDKYLEQGYQKIAVVAHGGVLRRFVGKGKIGYCAIYEVDYNKKFECFGWID
jgi:broad specificity phosphatase PhoE